MYFFLIHGQIHEGTPGKIRCEAICGDSAKTLGSGVHVEIPTEIVMEFLEESLVESLV